MYDEILVATDGSDRTRSAVAHGLGLAETYGATVHALYVADTRALGFDEEEFVSDAGIVDALVERGRRATAVIGEQARSRGLDAETAVVQGGPAREIRRYATEHDVDLVAMGTRGRSGIARHLLGSVAESVLRKASQPVLTARSTATARTVDYDRVLLPTDGGDQAERVREHAFDIAGRYDATVHALSVIDSSLVRSPALLAALEEESEDALTAVEQEGARRSVDVVTSVWRGTPADCITTYGANKGVDLVTMAAHEKRRLDRYLSLTVAERVVRTANCPVFTLRRNRE